MAAIRSPVEAQSCRLAGLVAAIAPRLEPPAARRWVDIHSLERFQEVEPMKGNPPRNCPRVGKRLAAVGIAAVAAAGIAIPAFAVAAFAVAEVAVAEVAVAEVAEIVARLQQQESPQERSARKRLAVLAVQAAQAQDSQS